MNYEQVEEIINSHRALRNVYIKRKLEARRLKQNDDYDQEIFRGEVLRDMLHACLALPDNPFATTESRSLLINFIRDNDEFADIVRIPEYALLYSDSPDDLQDNVNECMCEYVCQLINCTTFFADGKWCAQVVYFSY